MKILLVHAINPAEIDTVFPNLGLGYLVSALRQHFGKDTFNFKIIDRGVKKAILRYKPDILCLSSLTQSYNIAKDYAAMAKIYRIPVMIGGVHISMLPQSLSCDMDVGCVGEGERTIVELLSIFMKKGKFLSKDLTNIKGIVYRENGNLIVNPPREQITDLDEIPPPARDLFRTGSRLYRSYMFTSRGCPYNCIFCNSPRLWGKLRFFSVEYVVREIEELVNEYNVRSIGLYDDTFITSKQRLQKIVELLKGKRFYKNVKFLCLARADLVTDEKASLLEEMGVLCVGMGLESGSDRTLKYLKGGSISVEDNRKAIMILKRHNISSIGYFVIGAPQETKQEIMKTYFFIKDNPLTFPSVGVLVPLPGTAIWEYAKRRNLVSDDMDWSRLNVNFNYFTKNVVVLSEVLDRKQLIRIYKRFMLFTSFQYLRNIWFVFAPGFIFKMFFRLSISYFKRILKMR